MYMFKCYLSCVAVLVFCLLCDFCEAQIYYGRGNFGRLEILNDSSCTICFMIDPNIKNSMGGKITDTCSLIQSGDTIFISTKIRHRFDSVKCNYHYDSFEKYPTVYKKYQNYYGNDYRLVNEGVCFLYGNYIGFSDFDSFKKGDIIVFRNYVMYDRIIWVYSNDTHILIDNLVDSCCLDNFPLFIKGNKLMPIDKEKNKQCWIDNGFYFPTMKRSSKAKSFNTIPRWSLGLNGLPNGFTLPSNKYCKHRK